MPVEEERLWARICADLDELTDQARNYAREAEFQELLKRTRRRRDVSVWEWKELLDELAATQAELVDYAGRDGEHVSGRGPEHYPGPRPDFVFACPVGLCARRSADGPLGPKPRCELFGEDMAEDP